MNQMPNSPDGKAIWISNWFPSKECQNKDDHDSVHITIILWLLFVCSSLFIPCLDMVQHIVIFLSNNYTSFMKLARDPFDKGFK